MWKERKKNEPVSELALVILQGRKWSAQRRQTEHKHLCSDLRAVLSSNWTLASDIWQDLPNAMNAAEITDKLGLHSLRHRNWYIQATCATSGDGLYEGLDWLANQLKNKK